MDSDPASGGSEAQRLEQLWGGEFGNDYIDRNLDAYEHREPFWRSILAMTGARSVLEVGCNVGGNLRWLAKELPAGSVYGVDINRKALTQLHRSLPEVDGLWSPARSLPFRDSRFELVFTMGVLIHQPDSTLPLVMNEMVRCSSRWVLCGEYFDETATEVPYRGHQGALFRRDYGRLFAELFAELSLVGTGLLGRDDGWDDVTWWLFEKHRPHTAPRP